MRRDLVVVSLYYYVYANRNAFARIDFEFRRLLAICYGE